MKKLIAVALVLIMVLSFAACSAKTNEPQTKTPDDTQTSAPADDAGNGNVTAAPEPASAIAQAKDGALTVATADLALTVNGKQVKSPFKYDDLVAAGIKSEAAGDYEISAGSMFTANMYADENENYVVSPTFDNSGEASVTLADAEARSIRLSSYADAPEDVGVSLFGVKFGMSKSDVIALLGDPSDDSDGLYYSLSVSDDSDTEGSFTVGFTDDRVDFIDLSVY